MTDDGVSVYDALDSCCGKSIDEDALLYSTGFLVAFEHNTQISKITSRPPTRMLALQHEA